MKKIVIILAMAAFLFGCDKEFSSDNLNDDVFTVNLTLSGEVSVTEEPLTKSISSNDLVGIQVYQNDVPYAYGLFDDASKMSINLHTGKEYTFKSQIIKGGKSKLPRISMSSGQPCYGNYGQLHTGKQGDYYTSYRILPDIRHFKSTVYYFIPNIMGYGEPFCFNDIASPVYTGFSEYTTLKIGYQIYYQFPDEHKLSRRVTQVIDITNQFIYDSNNSMNITTSVIRTFNDNSLNIDRYYGEATFKNVTGEVNAFAINMKHLVYGLQCNVTGVSDGTASVIIKNGDNTLLEKADISGEYHSEKMMFGFSDMHSAWQYSDDYSENVTVSLTWHRGVGITQDLGSAVVQVKRNCMNVINVSLSTTTKACATLGVESEQSDMNIISIDSNTHF